MAVQHGYCSLDDLKEALQIDDADHDRRLERAIESASRGIDKVCRRKFYRESLTLYFSGSGDRARIDPFSERRLAGVHSLAVGDRRLHARTAASPTGRRKAPGQRLEKGLRGAVPPEAQLARAVHAPAARANTKNMREVTHGRRC